MNASVLRGVRWSLVVVLAAVGSGGGCDCGGGDVTGDVGDVDPDGADAEGRDGRDGDGADGEDGEGGVPCVTPDWCPRGPCEEEPLCIDELCEPGAPVSCEDGIACTADWCDPVVDDCVFLPDHSLCLEDELCREGVGCERIPCPARPCDDGLGCNGVEGCDTTTGFCRRGTPPCDDRFVCTTDPCSEPGIPPGSCGEPIPDDDRCPAGEICVVGWGCLLPCEGGCPDDGVACNGAPECVDDVCQPGTATVCPDDAVACTEPLCMEGRTARCELIPNHGLCPLGELCDPASGCVGTTCEVPCDDGFFCNGVETCTVDPAGLDRCDPGEAPVCDDGVDCTWSFCDEDADGCEHSPENGLCGELEFCDPIRDCTDDPCTADTVCTDHLSCTGVETCNRVTGACERGTPVDCDDGIACTRDECGESTGDCTSIPDHGLCPADQVCDPGAGGCTGGAPCGPSLPCTDDGFYCNGGMICDEAAGVCRPTPAPVCDDGIPCTVDACDETVDGCSFTPADSRCDDGMLCNGAETCLVGLGCASGAPPTCDDGDPCTVDGCETPPGSPGTCTHGPLDRDGDGFGPPDCGGDCDDGNPGRYPEALELCNAVDDNCDGNTDETFSCVRGAGHDCTTSCGTPGRVTCGASCTWGACAGFAEACNGRDDDCDGSTDEGFGCVSGSSRPCAVGSCAGAGAESCDPTCAWSGVCTPQAGYVEVCDGFDNDCDGVTDEDFGCVQYSSGTCPTSCGSTGGRSCTASCTWGACVPPREECNGRDDDCVNGCDDGFDCCAGRTGSCPTTCGSTGTRTCDAACSWNACVPPAETCNGRDDDCDTVCDDGFSCCAGAVGASCTTTCGSTGARNCSAACAWGVCVPPGETCNGRDDDCDTLCDDGYSCCAGQSGSCTTACGTTGSRHCSSACGWESCVPPVEACNGIDDDCDGGTDNGFLCRMGDTQGCTTSVGCPGLERCGAACTWGACEHVESPPANDQCAGAIPISAPGGHVEGSTCPGADNYAGSCGGSSALDVVYSFTLTVRSDVTLHTVGSSFDTVLYVRQGTCATGTELGCNAGRFGRGSFLQLVDLAAGTYYVFVDGTVPGQAGNFELEVSIAAHDDAGESCGRPMTSVISGSVSLVGSTTAYGNDATGRCRLTSDRDVVYVMYLAGPSYVVINTCTLLPTYDTFVYVRGVCTSDAAADEYGCNDQAVPACSEGPDMSRIVRPRLEAGLYYIFVDGAAGRYGDYSLQVDITPL